MSATLVSPVSTVSNSGSLTGGATAHAVLSDGSDSSYVSLDPGESFRVAFADPTIPAGAVIRDISVYVRAVALLWDYLPNRLDTGLYAGDYAAARTTIVPRGLQQWPAAIADQMDIDLDDAEFVAFNATSGGSHDIWVTGASLVVVYIAAPEPNIVYPTGTLTEDNTPLIRWDASGLDPTGGPQVAAQVRVWTDAVYSALGFDPNTAEAVFTAAILGPEMSAKLTDALPNGDYHVGLKQAQLYNDNGEWAVEDFTVDVDVPGEPTLDLTNDADIARVAIEFEAGAGDVPTTGYEIQRWDEGSGEWVGVRTLTDAEGTVEL